MAGEYDPTYVQSTIKTGNGMTDIEKIQQAAPGKIRKSSIHTNYPMCPARLSLVFTPYSHQTAQLHHTPTKMPLSLPMLSAGLTEAH